MTFTIPQVRRQNWTERLLSIQSPTTEAVASSEVPAFAQRLRAATTRQIDGHELIANSAQIVAGLLFGREVSAAIASICEPSGPSVVVVHNLPTDPPHLALLPLSGSRNPKRPTVVTEITTLAAIFAAGQLPVSYVNEAGPELIMHLMVEPQYHSTQSSRGGARLGMHVDNGFLSVSLRPDILVLTGQIASEPAIPTNFSPLRRVLEIMNRDTPGAIRTLLERRFSIRSPASFHLDGSAQVKVQPVSVLEHNDAGETIIRFSEYNASPIDPTDSDAVQAITALNEAAASPEAMIPITIRPGTLVVASNTKALHARGAIQGRRYLLRGYGKRDLTALRSRGAGSDSTLRYRFCIQEQLLDCSSLG